MEKSSIAKSSFCLFVQNDVMLTLELVHSGVNVNRRDLRYKVILYTTQIHAHIFILLIYLFDVLFLIIGLKINLEETWLYIEQLD